MTTPPALQKVLYSDTWKSDITAGIVVFLVALPLCLGIALASGASMASGLVAGIIGGIIVSWLSGSELSVSGPAAGLAVLVATGIETLGSLNAFSNVVLVAGLFQLILGVFRLGFIGSYIPSSVIKGMLAGIGVIIILKQFPHALGVDSKLEVDPSFLEGFEKFSVLKDAASAVYKIAPGMILVSLVAFAMLLIWETKMVKKQRWSQWLPGPLAAVLGATIMNFMLLKIYPAWAATQTSGHLVQIPIFNSFDSIRSQLPLPDFQFSFEIIKMGITIAIVGAIETLLSLEATDKLDPLKRTSNKNRELFAQGIGNSISGLIGGIPITGVIVRSSANIYAGAQTRLSGFIHGILLLFAVLFIPGLLNHIPLAGLATILIMVGYKLTNRRLLTEIYQDGWPQWVPFLVTLLTVVFVDLLSGVLVGIIAGFAVTIRSNFYSAMTFVNEGKNYLITFNKDVSFVHKPKLKKLLSEVPNGSSLLVDGGRAMFIDDDILEILHDFGTEASFLKIHFETKNCLNKRFITIQNR